jgi:glycosyltransferase involved in cell wall biosynthesis
LPPQVKIVHNHDDPSWHKQDFDLVHAFNITLNECLFALEEAQKRRIPLVVQTIFPPGIYMCGIENVRRIARESTLLLSNLKRTPFDMAEGLDLPQDMLEEKTVWVPAAAPKEWFLMNPTDPEIPSEPYIILAARYEDRKGQDKYLEKYLEAGLKLPIYLFGDHRHPVYGRCEELARGNPFIHVNGAISHDKLAQWYAGAVVSVLPTHYDNPGLTNLEAGITGCEVVTAGIPAIQEYLDGYAWYGVPGVPETYVEATTNAWEWAEDAGFDKTCNELAFHVKENFTWDVAGKVLYKAYERALGGSR